MKFVTRGEQGARDPGREEQQRESPTLAAPERSPEQDRQDRIFRHVPEFSNDCVDRGNRNPRDLGIEPA